MAVPAPDLASLRLLGHRVRPVTGADQRTLPVPEALAGLLPHAGLQRGSLVATGGAAATSLALALAGPVTHTGSWVAVVGLAGVGLLAAAELGVDLERVLLIADPGPSRWAATVAALTDAVDLVLARPPAPVVSGTQRRLSARCRERGSVILQVGGATGLWATAPDLVVSASAPEWQGVGSGHGHLRARRVEVSVTGRRGADRPRRAELWLPGPDGRIALVDRPTRLIRTDPSIAPSTAAARRPTDPAPVLEEAG
jgi:hypothetical protein